MSRLTSYQKLKQENERLRRELDTLVFRPVSFEALEITNRMKMSSQLGDSVWFGSSQPESGFFDGITSQIVRDIGKPKQLNVTE